MKSPIDHVGRRVSGQAIFAVAAVLFMLAAAVAADSGPKQEEMVIRVEQLGSEEPPTRNAAVDAILQDRLATVEKLITVIDPANVKKYSDKTRSAAAYLLGEYRAVEAVPVLSRSLLCDPGPTVIWDMSRYNVPIFRALVRIGRPAVPAMIENIETSDHRILRRKSLDVLSHILRGKRRLLELLAKLEKRTDDKETRRRLQECITWAREHYKETKEPLY